jgi:hypothetical protein
MSRPKVLDAPGRRFTIQLSDALGQCFRLYAAVNHLTVSQAAEELLQGPLGHLSHIAEALTRKDGGAGYELFDQGDKDPRITPPGWPGKDLKHRLEVLKITQRDFGMSEDISQQTICRWAKEGIPRKNIPGIAKMLKTFPWPPKR